MGPRLAQAVTKRRNHYSVDNEERATIYCRALRKVCQKDIQRLSGRPHAGTAVNVVPLVGHNVAQGAALGFDDVQPTREQHSQMERLVQEAVEQGARGLSTGLYYAPGFDALT
ncbi:MAG: hypothetical protein GTO63_31655 [Anaerolineae bacterium]|nr:hypothetical protein [Anaerolineae bacterium]NIN99247.1 hypothetical protein [Anaerolineae bacterium]NIQ82087.1 hypothetical protein [Anaerolineae bacterium]